MKHSLWMRAAAGLMSCALLMSTGFLAMRAYEHGDVINGRLAFDYHSDDAVYVQGGSLTIQNTTSRNADNFFGNDTYNVKATQFIAPGDTRTGKVTLTNNHPDKAIKVYLYAKPTDPAKYATYYNANKDSTLLLTKEDGSRQARTLDDIKSRAQNIGSQAILTIVDSADTAATSPVIYSGKLDGSDSVANDYFAGSLPEYVDEPTNGGSGGAMNDLYAISLGRLEKGETKTFVFKLSLPETLDNHYAATVMLIDWVFVAAYDEDEPAPTPTPPPETPPVPKTGDAAVPYVVAAVACAVSATALFVFAFMPRRRKETVEA